MIEALPSSCSCPFDEPDLCFGQNGWHVRLDSPNGTAYELCPAYWRAAGRNIDPMPVDSDFRSDEMVDGERKSRKVRYRGSTRLLSREGKKGSNVVGKV